MYCLKVFFNPGKGLKPHIEMYFCIYTFVLVFVLCLRNCIFQIYVVSMKFWSLIFGFKRMVSIWLFLMNKYALLRVRCTSVHSLMHTCKHCSLIHWCTLVNIIKCTFINVQTLLYDWDSNLYGFNCWKKVTQSSTDIILW